MQCSIVLYSSVPCSIQGNVLQFITPELGNARLAGSCRINLRATFSNLSPFGTNIVGIMLIKLVIFLTGRLN